jgi:hypothetical protein
MPLAAELGTHLPRQLPLAGVLAVVFVLGCGATLAEPAMGALRHLGSLISYRRSPLLKVRAGAGAGAGTRPLPNRRAPPLKVLTMTVLTMAAGAALHLLSSAQRRRRLRCRPRRSGRHSHAATGLVPASSAWLVAAARGGPERRHTARPAAAAGGRPGMGHRCRHHRAGHGTDRARTRQRVGSIPGGCSRRVRCRLPPTRLRHRHRLRLRHRGVGGHVPGLVRAATRLLPPALPALLRGAHPAPPLPTHTHARTPPTHPHARTHPPLPTYTLEPPLWGASLAPALYPPAARSPPPS